MATETEPKRGPSIVVQVGVLLFLTVAAAGIGWLSGTFLDNGQETKTQDAAPAGEGSAGHDASGHEGGETAPAAQSNVVDIPAITTNLAVPDTIWMRLELSLVFEHPPEDPELINLIHQDLMAYIRTVKLMQIEGPSGYQYLKSDLLERARIRSNGLVKAVLIRTMLVE
jgi:flagellar FliL protein